MVANPLTWPEINHLPDYYRSILEAHIRFREDPDSNDSTVRAPLSKEKLYELLFDIPWFANVKYDGTNLAISKDKKLYGRRQLIESPSYQKTDLTFLSKIDLSNLSKELLGNLEDKVSKLFVYGELIINNKFDYEKQDVFKKFLAFGICVEIPNGEIGKQIHTDLLHSGYVCNSIHKIVEGQAVKITVLLTDKLRNLFTKHNIPVGETIFKNGCLHDLIMNCGDWMINGKGEGLVCVSNEFQKKWKIGMEHQPSIFAHFKNCLSTISSYDDLDERVVNAAKVLFDVSESKKIMGVEASKSMKKPKVRKETLSLFPSGQMKAAIESALTKYDSLEYYFEANKLKEIITLIIAEVMHDLMPTVDTTSLLPNQDPLKEINGSVQKFVGIRYGMWKGTKRE